MPSDQRPVTDQERDQIRDLHAQGLGCNEIARQIGRNRWTVSTHAKAMGLSFDRARTREATAARAADNAATRAQLASDLLADAARLRAQLWEPCTIHSFGGRDNVYNEHPVDEPPFRDKRDIMSTVGVAVEKALRLTDYDANSGASEARSMLSSIAEALEVAAANLPPDDEA
ncbi:helix-turn-helix domain-containing protein [Nonomuraea sp. NPDC050547]|uniref:helix-turn-helix domain-containing protein n=1 Tax=Nonomuraea sp. NPDC050547 TaxID=3364368 RepID=UPI00379B5B91